MPITIDAHHHLWDRSQSSPFDYSWQDGPDLGPLQQNYLPADLKPLIDSVQIDRTVVVQTQHHLEENRWALSLAEQNKAIAGVVGWVDLRADDCEDQLQQFINHPKFVGIRHVVQDEPDPNWIIHPQTLAGLKVLQRHQMPYDLLFYVQHLPHVPALAQQLPDLPMVINHLAKPQIKAHRLDNWLNEIKEAASYPNLYCKLSGMITEADWQHWTAEDLKPYVQTALEAFGPSRCMFGSDWPVCLLAGSYEQTYHALVEALGPISPSERDQIFGQTAIDFYQLPPE